MEVLKSYPSKRDIRDVIQEKIPPARSKAFFKNKGILFLSQRREHIAGNAYLFFLGYDDLMHLKEVLDDEKNYRKSSVVKIKDSSCYENIVKTLASRASDIDDNAKIIVSNTVSGSIVDVSFIRKKAGLNQLLTDEKRKVTFHVDKGENGVTISIHHQDRKEYKVVNHIIDKALNFVGIDEKDVRKVSLDKLKLNERIELFDEFFKYAHLNWRLSEIKKVSLRKSVEYEIDNDIEEDYDADDDQGDDKQATSEQLKGLTSAILEGSGLRENNFVQDCLKSGFYFSGAKLRLRHMSDAKIIDLELSFRGGYNEMSIFQSGIIEDNKPEWSPYPHGEQDEILEYFQEVLHEIYSKIIKKRIQ